VPTAPPVAVGDLLVASARERGAPAGQHTALLALRLADGVRRWERTFRDARISGLSAAPGGLVLVALCSADLLHGQGALLALDGDGDEIWRWSPPARSVSAPALAPAGDTAYVTVDTGTLVGIDVATGQERRRTALSAIATLAAPAIAGDAAYVPCRGPRLLAVGLDGVQRWCYQTEDADAWLDKTPLAVGDRLYAVLTTGTAVALDARDGSLAWRANVGPPGQALGVPSTDGERLYVGARDGLHALDLDGGREVWHFLTGRKITAAPAAADGVAYAASHDHTLYALDAATGREIWRVEMRRRIEVGVAMGGDLVVVADRGGRLAAVERALAPEAYARQGRWAEAAKAQVRAGRLADAARLYEERLGEPVHAAELYRASGDVARVAMLYEAGGRYDRAETCYLE
jgi:outer membrane protein assembly factor BamB